MFTIEKNLAHFRK